MHAGDRVLGYYRKQKYDNYPLAKEGDARRCFVSKTVHTIAGSKTSNSRRTPVKTYNLFISHSWNYSDQYNRLVNLLRERGYFAFNNYSVPSDDPIHGAGTDTQLRHAIRNQMMSCHVVLILAGVYATHSKWINIEINLAKNGFTYAKPIIAIAPWGSERTSKPVKLAADRLVGWNSESVVRAIRDLS